MIHALYIFSELKIGEVSHDTVISVKNDLVSRGITNSFDTWHGKRNMFLLYHITCQYCTCIM